MHKRHVDVCIVGAGTAGMSAYQTAIKATNNVVVIESAEYGTTCARNGCMPSKLLIAAAEAAHTVERARSWGISAEITIDRVQVMERVRRERDFFVSHVLNTVKQWPEEHKIKGKAVFVDAQTLQVDQHTLIEFKQLIVAVGSSPIVPADWINTLGSLVVTNEEVFEWRSLPESLAVFGTGVIGLELAQALHRLGVRVRVFGRSGKVGILSDPALQKKSHEIFNDMVPLVASPQHIDIQKNHGKVVITWNDEQGEQCETFDYLLSAVGRQSNVGTLQMEKAGIQLNAKGMPDVDPVTGRIGTTAIYLAGDALGRRSIQHEAVYGGIQTAQLATQKAIKPLPSKVPLSIVFTDPQMCVVGQSHAELISKQAHFVYGEVQFETQGRSRVMGKHYGSLRVYVQATTGKLLGAEMLGPAAEHIGHLLAWAIQREDTVDHLLSYPFYHPVIEEGVRTALKDARKKR